MLPLLYPMTETYPSSTVAQPTYGFSNADPKRFVKAANHSDLFFVEDPILPLEQVGHHPSFSPQLNFAMLTSAQLTRSRVLMQPRPLTPRCIGRSSSSLCPRCLQRWEWHCTGWLSMACSLPSQKMRLWLTQGRSASVQSLALCLPLVLQVHSQTPAF